MLKFSPANAKLKNLQGLQWAKRFLEDKRKVYSIDTLSGINCPYAKECHSQAVLNPQTGRTTIQDGEHTKFRCFSASQEVLFKALYRLRKHNMDCIMACKNDVPALTKLIVDSLPANAGIVRLSVGGDFMTQAYFDAWMAVCQLKPGILFYAYTKSLPFWVKRLKELESIPNFVLTASYGGWRDDLIAKYSLRSAVVIGEEIEAGALPIDHDDSHAANPFTRNESFALLIHGSQPKGSTMAAAKAKLKGKGSYGRKAAIAV
jgi:Gene product 88